jgi:NAD(P)-dependent dehydrogenase (short-subunit alcohol dehydrogenase family)
MRLVGKVALVTGGGSGIGLATALAFLREGAHVAIADHSAARGREAVAAARAAGLDLTFLQADVSKSEDAARIVARTVRAFGRLDILFNNAGVLIEKPVHRLSEREWDRVLDVNLKGAFLVSRAAIPHMLRRGSGCIVNTGSVNSLVGDVGDPAYCASKGGIALLTRAMALDYAARGIRVNAVCPGWVETRMFAQEARTRGVSVSRYRAFAGRHHPIGRIGSPDEIADVVMFLASDESSYMTGALVVADGGFTSA